MPPVDLESLGSVDIPDFSTTSLIRRGSRFVADDYYSILGVLKTASGEEIQKAYRKLARKYHPDLADDKEKAKVQFQKIQHAYDVLSDSQKRELYDRFGPAFEQAGGKNPFAGGQMPDGADLEQIFGRGGGGGHQTAGFDDLLRQIFGGGAAGPAGTAQAGGSDPFGGFGGFGGQTGGARTRTRAARGEDDEQEITVPFATAILGGKHRLSLTRSSGNVETLTLTIPAGISSGKKIRLRGQGHSLPRGGQRGDLLVKVRVAPHPVYQRVGNNLQVVVPVTVSEAALGARIELSTPHGTVTLTVPPRCSSGRLLRLKGMGVRPVSAAAGDLVAELRIVMPSKLTSAQERLFGELASEAAAGENPRRELKW